MKNIKMFVSAICILAVVVSALAFRGHHFMLGNVWCFTSFPVPSRSCAVDPGGTNIPYNAVIFGGTRLNPCADGSPYISTADNCETPYVLQEYLPTGE